MKARSRFAQTPVVAAGVSGLGGAALVAAPATAEAGARAATRGQAVAPASTKGTIFVANWDNGLEGGSVTAYPPGASGDARPVVTITKGVDAPDGLAFETSGDLWVANSFNNTLNEYTRTQLAQASPAPSVVITSARYSNNLNGPTGLAFDSAGDLWVVNGSGDSVVEYTQAELTKSGAEPPRSRSPTTTSTVRTCWPSTLRGTYG